MSTNQRRTLSLSLAANGVLAILLIWSLAGRASTTPSTADLTPAVSPGSDEGPSLIPPTQTPHVVVVIATHAPAAEPAAPAATETPAPPPSATPEPTPSSPPLPSPTLPPTAVPGPDWLRYANLFRTQSNLPQLTEDPAWSEGSRLHSIYVVKSGQIWHDEDPSSPWFSQAGREAAANGNLAASDYIGETDLTWAIDYWMTAPFHALPFLDPELLSIGYGSYREEGAPITVAATMDIKRGQGAIPAAVNFPITFPRADGQTWVLKHALPEFPNPLASCPGYQRPAGPPIMLQIGNGDQVPAVSEHAILLGDQPLEHCIFDETSYQNPANPGNQQVGRLILDNRDAIVLIPRAPLQIGNRYTVRVVVNGQAIEWQFEAVAPPALN